MVATLQSRKDALEAKIREKNEELKKLCMQEADLTGVIPPEIPLEPGEPPPQLRRRVGTSFSFPQTLINSVKSVDDESLNALELECKVQTNIAEAALALANNTSVNKSVRRQHRLMYRQSQRRLMELETRLTLLRQGKSHPIKLQQVKKKPRPNINTEAVPSEGHPQYQYYYNNHDTWGKNVPQFSVDEVDSDFSTLHKGSLIRVRKTSQSSPRLDDHLLEEVSPAFLNAYNTTALPGHLPPTMASSLSHPNIQGVDEFGKSHIPPHRRSARRGAVNRQWDTMSAGGTLLPSQTYPDHSHHPNLSRAQSLGSVEATTQRQARDSWSVQDFKNEPKEKEWYETLLDSAPSPPLRTSSRLPPAARKLYNLKEAQIREAVNQNLVRNTKHMIRSPSITPTGGYPSQREQDVIRTMQDLNVKERSRSVCYDQPPLQDQDLTYRPTSNVYDNYDPVQARKLSLQHQRYEDDKRPRQENRQPRTRSDSVVIDIPEDILEQLSPFKGPEVPSPTFSQPYYHMTHFQHHKPEYRSEHNHQKPEYHSEKPEYHSEHNHHPAHAIQQNEVYFDTVVPFESPQNHTVIQAGKWQPYREMTKPFEMSDFYKYSTKFKQSKPAGVRAPTPVEGVRNSPTLTHQKGIYQPLQPMTCQPLDYKPPELNAEVAEISQPEIV